MRVHFIQHVPFETPGYLLNWVQMHGHTASFTKIYKHATFPATYMFDVLVIMGGPMGVYEEEKFAWLAAEKKFIRTAINAQKKVLGICLGAQLIAEVMGARVYTNTEKEIGWWPVQNMQAHALTQPLPLSFTTFHWHGDTFDLPAGAVHLFKTAACTNQGFVVNDHMAGLQFHMEATELLIGQMLEHCGNELQPAHFIQTADTIREGIALHAATQAAYLTQFMEIFVSDKT